MQVNPSLDTTRLSGLGIKPLASLIAHPRLALAVFLLLFLAGIPVAWIKGQASYYSVATVQVAARYMKNIKDDNELDFQSNSQYRQFVEHQARSVARADIVSRALRTLSEDTIRQHFPAESERRTIERLQERLVVVPVPDTYMMQISMAGKNRAGLAEIINAVVDSYLLQMKSEQMFGSDARIKNLQQREAELMDIAAVKTARRTQIALELGVASFNDREGNPWDKLLLDTRNELAQARNARLSAQSRQSAFLTHGETDLVTRSIGESVLSDPGLNSFKAGLNNRRAALATQVSGLTPQHPSYQAARQELLEIDREIGQQTAGLKGELMATLRARFATALEQAQRYEAGIEQVLVQQEKSSARFAVLFNEAMTISSELDQHNKEIDSFRERMNFFAAERSSLGFVRIVSPALVPEIPYGPGRRKLLMLVLVMAVLGGLVAPIAADLLNRRVRTVNDVERELGLPSLGWLLERDGMAAKLFADDQLRRIAGALIREHEQHGSQIFPMCGVKPGGGVSDLILDLAQVLNSLGYPTLAVEANAFRPDRRFDGGQAGLMQCLQGEATAADCIVPATANLPARVAVGVAPGQSHLARLESLPEVLQQFTSGQRILLVDMPPLLLSADAEIMISRLGRVLLVVEAGVLSRGELARAGRLLTKSANQAAGLIVNRVRAIEGGGYVRQLMVEFLTQRKFGDYASVPSWQLYLQGLRMAGWGALWRSLVAQIPLWLKTSRKNPK